MRIKSTKVDRVMDEFGGNFESYSDYSDSPSSNHSNHSDRDVKDSLRCSIREKSKLRTEKNTSSVIMHFPSSLSNNNEDSMSNENTTVDVETVENNVPTKKSRKPKIEDEDSVALRRERNRIAAQRCRQRRRDRIDKLEKICERLESDGDKLESEIGDLQKEINELQRILSNHKCLANPPIKTEIFMPSVK